MYLLLILLVSPAFGRPSSDQLDVGGDISNQLDDIMEFSKETGKLLNNNRLFGKVYEDLREAEKNIAKMEAELESLQSKIYYRELQGEDNFFHAFYETNSYLRNTRQELRELAYRTVAEVRNLKIVLEALDNRKHPILLKIVINRMKDLMIETGERLEEARKKYNSANFALENLISSVDKQKKIVGKEVDEHYRKLRLDEDYTNGVKTCKVLSWFTLGLCSLIHHYENAVPLEKASVEVEKLQTKADKILEMTQILNTDIEDAIGFITEEIDLIDKWSNSAEHVSKNIDNYPEEYLRKYETIKTAFKNGIDDLKKFAEQFLAQTIL